MKAQSLIARTLPDPLSWTWMAPKVSAPEKLPTTELFTNVLPEMVCDTFAAVLPMPMALPPMPAPVTSLIEFPSNRLLLTVEAVGVFGSYLNANDRGKLDVAIIHRRRNPNDHDPAALGSLMGSTLVVISAT